MKRSIRDALINFVAADFAAARPGVELVHDNAPFDRNKIASPFVEFEIKFFDGRQVGVAAAPRTRLYGFVYVTAWVPAGTGNGIALDLTEWFETKLKYQHVGFANLQAPEPADSGAQGKWWMEQTKLFFYSDPA